MRAELIYTHIHIHSIFTYVYYTHSHIIYMYVYVYIYDALAVDKLTHACFARNVHGESMSFHFTCRQSTLGPATFYDFISFYPLFVHQHARTRVRLESNFFFLCCSTRQTLRIMHAFYLIFFTVFPVFL